MITIELIEAILTQYRKHGWKLRRVLLLPELRSEYLDALTILCGDAEIAASDVNGAWFSRPSAENREAWELRHLSETPFALYEAFAYDADEDFCSGKKLEMETRLRDETSESCRSR